MRNFRPSASRGNQQRLLGRELLDARCPEMQAGEADIVDRVQQRAGGVGMEEPVDGRQVVEQERQVEQAVFLGVGLELGERGRGELHVAEQHGFLDLVVVEERGVREDLHAGLAVHLLVDAFGQHVRRDALRVGFGHVMAELDDDFAVVAAVRKCAGCARRECEQANACEKQFLHVFSPPLRAHSAHSIETIRTSRTPLASKGGNR